MSAGGLTQFVVDLVKAIAFGLLVLAHGRLKTTPGKWLFQISITDQHGLPASPIRLMPRLILSQFPISLELVFDFFGRSAADGFGWLAAAQAVITGGWFIANVASVVIDKRRLALHDRLLGTRAVVEHAR
jgi:uncharacterized RDD family membrane protein YckC